MRQAGQGLLLEEPDIASTEHNFFVQRSLFLVVVPHFSPTHSDSMWIAALSPQSSFFNLFQMYCQTNGQDIYKLATVYTHVFIFPVYFGMALLRSCKESDVLALHIRTRADTPVPRTLLLGNFQW